MQFTAISPKFIRTVKLFEGLLPYMHPSQCNPVKRQVSQEKNYKELVVIETVTFHIDVIPVIERNF